MRYTLIIGGNVDNVIEINPYVADEFQNAVPSDLAGIGDEYIDGRFYRNGELLKTPEELYAETLRELENANAELAALGAKPIGKYFGSTSINGLLNKGE